MLTRNVAYYEARVVFGGTALLPALLLPAYLLLGWLVWMSQDRTPTLNELQGAIVYTLPISAALAAAHLMTIEREEAFDGLRRSYPEPAWRVPLLRAVGALLLMGLTVALSGLIFIFIFGEYDFSLIALPAIAPSLYLTGLALLINNLAGNYWVSAAGVVAYWFMEARTLGAYTRGLFLFYNVAPLPGIDADTNQVLLVTASLFWFTLNIGYSIWRRRRACG